MDPIEHSLSKPLSVSCIVKEEIQKILRNSKISDIIDMNDIHDIIDSCFNQEAILEKTGNDIIETEQLTAYVDIQQNEDSRKIYIESYKSVEQRLILLQEKFNTMLKEVQHQRAELSEFNIENIKKQLNKFLIVVSPADGTVEHQEENICVSTEKLVDRNDEKKECKERMTEAKRKPTVKFVVDEKKTEGKSALPIHKLDSIKAAKIEANVGLAHPELAVLDEEKKAQRNDGNNFNLPKQEVEKQSKKLISAKGTKSFKKADNLPIPKTKEVEYQEYLQFEENMLRFSHSKETLKLNRRYNVPVNVPRKELKLSMTDIQQLQSGGIVILNDD